MTIICSTVIMSIYYIKIFVDNFQQKKKKDNIQIIFISIILFFCFS